MVSLTYLFVDDWQKLVSIATIASAIATVIYTVSFLITIIYIVRQLEELKMSRQLQSDLALFEETRRRGTQELFRTIYSTFCDNDFRLDPSIMQADFRANIGDLIAVLSRVGALLQDSVFIKSASFALHTDFFIRCWLLLDEYIQHERNNRHNPAWQASVQYLTVLSLRVHLQNTTRGIVIYHPDEPSIFREYKFEILAQKLKELENSLGAMPLPNLRKLSLKVGRPWNEKIKDGIRHGKSVVWHPISAYKEAKRTAKEKAPAPTASSEDSELETGKRK